jgi:small-conductance mechanosensitive channel
MKIDFSWIKSVFIKNILEQYSVAFLIWLGLLIVLLVFKYFLIKRIKKIISKSKNDFDDFLINLIESIKPFFYVYLSFYFAFHGLNLGLVNKWLELILIICITLELGSKIKIIIDYSANKYLKDKKDKSPVNIIKRISTGLIWFLGLLILLTTIGVNITSLIAGLGIGGVAVALAIQNILSDLFSSFAIYLDKPFEVGDFIVIEDKMGTVEKIGIKTTRIKALQGEEIVISNNDLTNAKIHNYKKMKLRRVSFKIGVVYSTSKDKLLKINKTVSDVIKNIEGVKFERIHLESLGDSSLNFEVVYYVQSADYMVYMDKKQEINLKIFEVFSKNKIHFAFPSQSIYLKK